MDPNQLISHSRKWDSSGVFFAVLCLIHCLSLPLLTLFLPSFRFLFANSWFEILVFTAAIFVGTFSLTTSFLQHRKIHPMLLGLTGLALLALSLVNEHSGSSDTVHTAVFDLPAIFGGFFLISGHLWNLHICHCFCDPGCPHQEHKSSKNLETKSQKHTQETCYQESTAEPPSPT